MDSNYRKIDITLAKWNQNKPTMQGRRLIINMFVGGMTQYLTKVQGMPEPIENSLINTIRNFMWNNQHPTIALSTLENNFNKGGCKLLDLKA